MLAAVGLHRNRIGDLLGLDQPLEGGGGEQDVVDDLGLGDPVRLGLVGDLLSTGAQVRRG